MAQLQANLSILSEEDKRTAQILVDAGQAHLFAPWPAPGSYDREKKQMLAQAREVEKVYPGGAQGYVNKAKDLLHKAKIGANPYAGFQVSEPSNAVRLENPQDFDAWEAKGLPEAKFAGFVMVAGGLGERLGYQGIKISLPADIITNKTFIQLYIEHILALQDQANTQAGEQKYVLPLGIMTSDDTDRLTRALLRRHRYFGMDPKQITIFKQGKVPALLDNDAHFALDASNRFAIDTKPHGHGDVHTLLYQHDVVNKWISQYNTKWVVFFQDTNGLVFRAIPAALGVSAEKQLHVNSITVPRVQGDAVGAICKLTRDADSKEGDLSLPNPLTINVEYNQLEGLLGKGVKEPLVSGSDTISVYPGNINVLVFNANDYNKVLQAKKGVISEFVNPKYKAGTDNNVFNKPTRLECMMQDYPKLLDNEARVSFTQFERWTAFSAVKNALADGAAKQKTNNAPETASTGEADVYNFFRVVLRQAGVDVGQDSTATFSGVTVPMGSRIVCAPRLGVTQSQLRSKFSKAVKVSENSTLVLDGQDITVESLNLNGALDIRAVAGAKVVIRNLNINNKGYHFTPIENESKVRPHFAIRGYTLSREEGVRLNFTQPGDYVLSDETLPQLEQQSQDQRDQAREQRTAAREQRVAERKEQQAERQAKRNEPRQPREPREPKPMSANRMRSQISRTTRHVQRLNEQLAAAQTKLEQLQQQLQEQEQQEQQTQQNPEQTTA